ncbi:hypothetical protein F5X96DRAFT_425865 [Biscogniauxia mediterranea]|nr:hypothetical protein F5X96DRAFT_425865 [Biscogniauxia mediterranea]
MILLAVVLLTVFPPGFLFPAMAEREARRFRSSKGKKRNRDAKGEKKIAEKMTDEPIVSGDEETQAARGRGLIAAEEERGPKKVVAETV